MKLDVRPCYDGRTLDFSCELSLAELEFYREKPFAEPVSVTGSVQGRAGALELSAVASTELRLLCGRCAEPFQRHFELPVTVFLAETVENPEDSDENGIVPLKDGVCDIEEIIVPALILEMGMRNLCREDCLGLCHECGANLNNGPCGCAKKQE